MVEAGENDWEKYWDDASQRHFYYCVASGVSQFERPRAFRTPRPAEGQQALEQAEGADGTWSKYYDEASGYDFHYNNVTGESTYDRPPFFQTPRM